MLVFLSHGSIFMNLDLGYVRNLIEPVYVNAFFFVSGYLFFRKYLSANICKSAILIGGVIAGLKLYCLRYYSLSYHISQNTL